MRAFADQCDTPVQQLRLQLIWRRIIAIANLALLAYYNLFIHNYLVNHTAGADDGIKEQDGIAYNRTLLNNHTRRKHTALDMSLDDAAVRNQTFNDLRTTVNMGRRPLFAACVNHPGWIIEVEGGVIIQQFHVRFP